MCLLFAIMMSFLHIVRIESQLSYIPSRLFTSCTIHSYSDQIIMTNYKHPGSPLNATYNSNFYTVAFGELHDNINHHAITYSGHVTPVPKIDCAFSIVVIKNLSTSY